MPYKYLKKKVSSKFVGVLTRIKNNSELKVKEMLLED